MNEKETAQSIIEKFCKAISNILHIHKWEYINTTKSLVFERCGDFIEWNHFKCKCGETKSQIVGGF